MKTAITGSVPRPIFLEENVVVRFLLGERYFQELSVFRRSLILKRLILRLTVPRPFFGKEKTTRLHVPLCEKYQVYQCEGRIFRSSSTYDKTVSVLHPFLLREVNCTEQYVSTSCTQLLVLRIKIVYACIVSGLTHVRVGRVCSRHIKTFAVQYTVGSHLITKLPLKYHHKRSPKLPEQQQLSILQLATT